MMQGWIALHRQITENELYFSERFTRMQAWIDLLLLANHEPNTFFIRGNEVHTERGELGYAMVSLAHRWKWNKRTVKGFLSWLERRRMIDCRHTSVTTFISIQKYNEYQDIKRQSAQQIAQQNSSKVRTNNYDKQLTDELSEKENSSNETSSNQNELRFLKFVGLLKTELGKRGYQLNEVAIQNSLGKDFILYGEKPVRNAFTRMLQQIDKGREVKDPLSYGKAILKARKRGIRFGG